MTTMHGLVMVFGAIMPSFVGLANWMIPMMIGAPDMALPRMNNWSFWLLPPAFPAIGIHACLWRVAAPAFGWTFYAPLSTTYAGTIGDLLYFRGSHPGTFIDYGLDQYHCHHGDELCGRRV